MLIKRSALSINHPQRNSCSWIMTVLSSKDNSTGTKPTKPAIDSSFIRKNLSQEIQIWINNSATLFINVFTDLIGDGNLFRAEWSELYCTAKHGWEPTPSWEKETSWAAETARPKAHLYEQGETSWSPTARETMSVLWHQTGTKGEECMTHFDSWMCLAVRQPSNWWSCLKTLCYAVICDN